MVDQVIKLKRNTSNSNAPGTSDIAVGELAIGAVAGKLYIRKSDDSILEFTDASASSSAADDITTGDAAVTIATTSGNITLDAQANDSDIIFKGTDGGSDTTFLTIDGSAAGAATFNDKIVATELDISGDVDIDGTLEADAVTVNGTALSSVIAGTTVTLASTATALANARTIGGVSFDGSANITPTTFAAATFSGDVNVDSGVLFVDVSENKIGINQASPDVSLDLGANTDSIHVPVGTTAQRPGSPAAGYFRYNSTSGKFEGYTDAWGSIGGGSGTNMDTNIFAGDGSDTTFTLSTAPDTENNLMVFVDGVFQAQNVYSVSGTTLTFATAPANGRVITVYHSTTTVGGSNNTINTMTGDNSDTTLTLSVAPVHENNVQVYFDGVYQSKSNYAIDGTTLTFSTAPATGVLVEAITNTNTSSTTANQLVDADGDTKIQVEESSDEDTIRFDIAGTEQIVLADGVLKPTTDNDIDLGTSSLEFKNAYFDGTVTSDAFAGPLTGDVTGNVTGNVSGTAATVTGAAQTNITSLGTLTTLTVDDITINGSTISDAGAFDIDAGGNIKLDAGGGQLQFYDDGTEIGVFESTSSNFIMESKVQDKDIIFKGDDNGSGITALTLDMSEAGAATFNDKVIADSFETTAGGTLTTASGNDLNIVYPDSRSLFIKEGSTTHIEVDNTGKLLLGKSIGTPSGAGVVQVLGGSGGSGNFEALTLQHHNSTTTNDGPSIAFEGRYNSNDWNFGRIKTYNNGSGFGANMDFDIHPADGNQNPSLVTAMTIRGDGGSAAKVGIGTTAIDEATLLVQSTTEIATGGSYNTFGNLHVSTDTQGQNNGGTISMGGLGRTSGPTEYFRFAQISGRAESASNGSPEGYMCFETTSGVTNLSTERMRLTSVGNLLLNSSSNVGVGAGGMRLVYGSGESDGDTFFVGNGGGSNAQAVIMLVVQGEGFNTNHGALHVGRHTGNSRSINAGGSINASGADYAEYMLKSDGCADIAKGEVCGVDADGKLTKTFSAAKSFVVKSTDPSYVGADTWWTEKEPEPKYTDDTKSTKTDDWKDWDTRREAARVNVDRVAFSGQVPVNITGSFSVGDYVYPQANGSNIQCVAKSTPTFEEYQICVGKIWTTMDDGRPLVAVKIG